MDRTKKKLCFLDWNGTVQDDMHHIYECGVQRIFREFELPCPTLDQYRHEVTHDFMVFYHAHGIPKDVTADDLNAIMREGFKEKGAPSEVFEDAHASIAALRSLGFVIVVVSGYAQAKLEDAIERNGMNGDFVEVIGDVRDKKGEYGLLVNRHSPRLVIGIGDSIDDAIATESVYGSAYLCCRGIPPADKLRTDVAASGCRNTMIVPRLWDVIADIRLRHWSTSIR